MAMNLLRTATYGWGEMYLEGNASFMSRETEVAVDSTTSPEKLRKLMSEVISLRERVTQAELAASRYKIQVAIEPTGATETG